MRWFFLVSFALTGPAFAASLPEGNIQVIGPPGLRVYIDGRLAGISTAAQNGLVITAIPAGQHVILVRKPGLQSRKSTVVVQAGTTLEFEAGKMKVRRRIRGKPAEEPVDMTVGSPPMAIDDTDTPGDGKWEINVVFDGDLSADSDSWELPLMDVNYGVGEDLQLKVEVPYVVARTVESDAAGNAKTVRGHGVGDTAVGAKYRLYDDQETNLSLAVYPQVEFRTPGARAVDDGGGAERGTTWLLPIIMTRDFDHLSITANATPERTTGQSRGKLFAGFGAGMRVTDKTAVLTDVAGLDLSSSGNRRLRLEIGTRHKLSERHALVASAGVDVHAGGDSQRHHYFAVGYQRFLGGKQ